MQITRRVVLPCSVLVAVVIAVAAVVGGREAALGATVGGVLVLAFLAASPGLLDPVAKASPVASLPVALAFFSVKAVVAIGVLLVLMDPDGIGRHLSTHAVATAMVVTALAWIGLHAVALRRSRTPTYDLG